MHVTHAWSRWTLRQQIKTPVRVNIPPGQSLRPPLQAPLCQTRGESNALAEQTPLPGCLPLTPYLLSVCLVDGLRTIRNFPGKMESLLSPLCCSCSAPGSLSGSLSPLPSPFRYSPPPHLTRSLSLSRTQSHKHTYFESGEHWYRQGAAPPGWHIFHSFPSLSGFAYTRRRRHI